jgi:hypothetical protein
MKGAQTPKTLLMTIQKQWLVDNITSLGSGYLTYLVYQNEQIEPQVLNDIHNKQLNEKVLGEIVFQDQQGNRRIAEAELVEANNFQTFIRFDLRLLEVVPFTRGKRVVLESNFLCYYKSPA